METSQGLDFSVWCPTSMISHAEPPTSRARCCCWLFAACTFAAICVSFVPCDFMLMLPAAIIPSVCSDDMLRPWLVTNPVGHRPTAFIAGASEGLGAAWADYFASRGIDLYLVARHGDALEQVASRLRVQHRVSVKTSVLDLASNEVVPFAKQTFHARSNISILVYNAAYTGSRAGLFASDSLEMAHKAIDVNIKSVLTLVHSFLRSREARGESEARDGIVLMSSMAGLVGSAYISTCVSRFHQTHDRSHFCATLRTHSVLICCVCAFACAWSLFADAATKSWNTAFATGLYDELKGAGVDVLSCIAGATTTPNYLEKALPTRSRAIEQTPERVVQECASALGHVPTRTIGALGRFSQALLTRLLPTKVAVRIMSSGALSTTTFDDVGPGMQRRFDDQQ